MRVELAACEMTLLSEIGCTAMKQSDVSLTYAMAIRSSERDRVDWKKVNTAIIERWSRSGLLRIKRYAWKRLEATR